MGGHASAFLAQIIKSNRKRSKIVEAIVTMSFGRLRQPNMSAHH
jgi:hypothetical protein